MDIYYDSGIVLQYKEQKLVLDPSRIQKQDENKLVAISHAHSDHLKKHKTEVIMTPETRDLAGFEATLVNYNKEFEFGDLTVIPRNANHIMGSSQFEIHNGKSITYTGDFKLNDSLLFDSCHVSDTDVLVIESTYGMPHFKFPEVKYVLDSIGKWVNEKQAKGSNILFGSYALGKSQEVIKTLNNLGIKPVVHPKIAYFSEIYNKHNHNLEFISSESPEAQGFLKKQFTAIMPQHLINKQLISAVSTNGRDTSAALLTGWGSLYSFASKGIERVFPLSDHADFNQLIDYISQSDPHQVFTVHGYEKEFAKTITKKLGIPACSLKQKTKLI